MNSKEKKKLQKKVGKEVEDVYKELQELGDFKISHIWKFIVIVVENIEDLSEGLSGQEKKEIAVFITNNLVNIPIVPEGMEEKVFSLLIDIIVETYNGIFGNRNWKKGTISNESNK